jgi:hypothetical protein
MMLRIILLVMLMSLLGCTTAIPRTQMAQPVAEDAQQENSKKTGMPTFTYRPGW